MAGDRIVFALLAALVAVVPAAADEARLLAEEAAAIVPVTGEVRVVVQGIRGDISVVPGIAGEIRFTSARPGKKEPDYPVAVWLDGGTFRFLPCKDVPETGRVIEVHVPVEMNVIVDASDSSVLVGGITSSAEIRGERLQVKGGSPEGSFDVDVQAGTVAIEGPSRGVSIRGRDLDVHLTGTAGASYLRLTKGRARIENLGGAVDADLEGVALNVEEIGGPVSVRARGGGSVAAQGLAQGGDFSLTGAPLTLTRSRGDFTVESDGEVRFQDNKGSFHFNGLGGSVRGSGNSGLLEVKTSNAEIVLEGFLGPVRVQGDGLKLSLKDIGGELIVYATSSDIQIDGASGDLTVENTRGDVAVKGATGAIGVKTSGGDVSVLGMIGPAQVEADGRSVVVSWTSLPVKDSLVRNDGGDVAVHFPAGGSCRVEARSKFGRVETDLPRVEILEGGSSAQGVIGNGSRQTIRVESGGDVQLLGGPPAQPG
jgi:hypothetical protein